MADPKDIADGAIALARRFLDEARARIIELSEGDTQALFRASQIVRDQAAPGVGPHAVEHVAFSLITDAHAAVQNPDGDEGAL